MSVPRSPMDVDTTKRLIDERIARGEITQGDVDRTLYDAYTDLIKKGYRWMALSTLLGATSGLPIWFLLARGRRLPFLPTPMSTSSSSASASAAASGARAAAGAARGQGRVQVPPLAFRIAVTSMIAGSGSFLGFTAAGAAAALEVNNKMVDSKRKMKVFEEVMIASRAEAEARRLGLPAPISSASSSSSGSSSTTSSSFPMPDYGGQAQTQTRGQSRVEQELDMNGDDLSSVWDPEKAEMAREREREAGRDGSGQIRPVSTTQSAWDRVRQGGYPSPSSTSSQSASPSSSAFPSTGGSVDPRTLARTSNTSGTGFAGGGLQGPQGDLSDGIVRKGDEERERERREFEEIMERERRAGEGAGEAGFEKGRW